MKRNAKNQSNNLAKTNPELLCEWHPTKNGELKPEDFTKGSNERVWWKCKNCGFEWRTEIYHRTTGTGCPKCKKKVNGIKKSRAAAKINNLVASFPELKEEWNYEKNGDLKPEDFSKSSNKKVWWLCKNCGFEWGATINHRTAGTGCPKCAKVISGIKKIKTASKINNLAEKFPELKEEWNYEKNGELKPEGFSKGSQKKVWWKCSYCGNEWKDSISHRTSGRGCPHCSKSQTSFVEQCLYFYVLQAFPDALNRYMHNGKVELDIFIPSANAAIEYDGYYYHTFDGILKKENKKDEYCKNNDIKLFRFRCKKLKDTDSAIRLTYENHQIKEGIKDLLGRLNFDGIIDVDVKRDYFKIRENFRQVESENSFAAKNPELVSEWNYEKNGKLSPYSMPAFSNIYVWWTCSKCGCDYQTTPNHRSNGGGCSICAGKKVVEGINDLKTLCPDLAKEWNYDKNGQLLPTQVSLRSNKKVWWKCLSYGHEWLAKIGERTRPGQETGCPYCKNKKVLAGYNDLATTNPELCKQWNYAKNGDLRPSDVSHGSHKKVWWICEKCGHEWPAAVYSRVLGNGCPECYKKRHEKNN